MVDILRFNKIEFRNYRAFKSLEVHFHERLTAIVAPNGGGKTAVLDGVAMSLQLLVDGLMGKKNTKTFQQSDAHKCPDAHGFMQPFFPVSMSGTMKVPMMSNPVNWSIELNKRTSLSESSLIRKWANIVGANINKDQIPPIEFPVFAYYGTGRLWGELRNTIKRKTADTTPNARERGYQDCLNPSSHYGIFHDWFRRFSYQSKQERDFEKQEAPRHEAQRYLDVVVNAADLALAPSGWGKLAWDFAEDTITAQHPQHGRLPVDVLSDGIRAVIGLIADIAHRAARLNPHLGMQANTSPGVVLIDEVDMHLHPEWQQQILHGLLTAFPNIQFIITTHSPQVLTTLRREQVRRMTQVQDQWVAVMPDESPLGHASVDALSKVMEVSPVPAPELVEAVQWARDYEALVKAGKESDPESMVLLQRMTAVGYQVKESDLQLWRFLSQRGKRS